MSVHVDGLAIETSGLVKVFGDTRALDGIDLAVPAGTVYGVLGPNGAGKTTAVRVLCTLLRPDGGEARVFGHDVLREPDAVRSRVSLTGQYASVDEDLTGTENLILLARLIGYPKPAARARAAQLLDAFGLTEAAGRQVKNYSGGMRRRLDIAARVLLTTQYLDEADHLASRIAVIDHGKVIAEGTPGELKSSVGSGTVHVRLRDPRQRPEAARVLARVLHAQVQLDADAAAVTARILDGGAEQEAAEQASRALAELARSGITVDDFSLGQPSLDEVFLVLTDHPAVPDEETAA
jgi:ABC-2 type transport system ATP-binding protein